MKRTNAHVAALLAVTMAALFTLSGQAYVTYGKWGRNEVGFYINPQNADVSASAAEAAVVSAMNAWSTAGSAFHFLYVGRSNDTTVGYDNKNVIIFRPDGDGSAIARTYSWSSGSSIVDADVIFYDGPFTYFTGTSGCGSSGYGVYVEDVAAHELGHALGLLHTDVADATMVSGYAACSMDKRSLASDDVAGLQALYSAVSVQPPAAPSGLGVAASATNPTSSLIINWADNANNEDGYRIERSTDGATFGQVAQLGANSRSYTNSGLLAGSTYFYRVSAYNAAGASGFSNVASGQTQNTTNTAPSVSIGSPGNNSSYPQGVSITFSGSASDTQDGSLNGSLQWTSNLSGNIGSGASFSRTLTVGTHTVTASVTDRGGLTGSARITVTVAAAAPQPAPAPAPSTPTLTARGYKVKGVQTVDLSWAGLSGGSVDVYRGGAFVFATTNDGSHTDNLNSKGGGDSYTYKVCATGTSTCSNTATVSF